MDFYESYLHQSKYPSASKYIPFQDSDYLIAVYTVLLILREMQSQLGIEAMLDYLGRYIQGVEQTNPRLKEIVRQIVAVLNVEKFYQDIHDDG